MMMRRIIMINDVVKDDLTIDIIEQMYSATRAKLRGLKRRKIRQSRFILIRCNLKISSGEALMG